MKHLTVVLLVTLAAGGGNAARLCEMFCASPETTAHHCRQHSGDAPLMSPADCVNLAAQPPTAVRELRPRDASAFLAFRAISPDAVVMPSNVLLHAIFTPGRSVRPGHYPPIVPLRI